MQRGAPRGLCLQLSAAEKPSDRSGPFVLDGWTDPDENHGRRCLSLVFVWLVRDLQETLDGSLAEVAERGNGVSRHSRKRNRTGSTRFGLVCLALAVILFNVRVLAWDWP